MKRLLKIVLIGGGVLVLLLLVVCWRLFFPPKIIIRSPTVGILNLIGEPAAMIVAKDEEMLTRVLGSPRMETVTAPRADVLFVYCDIDRNGRVKNSSSGLREIIRDSGAKVVVVASENNAGNYIAAGGDPGYGSANLVMTLSREGDAFTLFFERLFGLMRKGRTMPVAWNDLAPQIPGYKHEDVPQTIFSCELGQLTFE